MDKTSQTRRVSSIPATREDIERLFGELEDEIAIELLELRPTVIELEEAAAWQAGQGDLLAREGHPQSSRIAAILELVQEDEEADERREPS